MKKSGALEAFLKQRKITHAEAAKRLNVPRATVWRWLKGKTDPSPMARVLIEAKLNFKWPEGKGG
jgi:transcriptional regulator with XRE-family HTH domain